MQSLTINSKPIIDSQNSELSSLRVVGIQDLRGRTFSGPYRPEFQAEVAVFDGKISELATRLGCGDTRRRNQLAQLIREAKAGTEIGQEFAKALATLREEYRIWNQPTPPRQTYMQESY